MATRAEVNAATKLLQDEIDGKVADRKRIVDAYAAADRLDDLAQAIDDTGAASIKTRQEHYTVRDPTVRAALVSFLHTQAAEVRASVVVPDAPVVVTPVP